MNRFPMRTASILLAIAALGLAAACEKAPSGGQKPAAQTAAQAQASAPAPAAGPNADIQKAVVDYVEKVRNIDTSKMTVTVKDAKIEGDKATCTVVYGLPDGSAPGMTYNYDLAKENGVWKVLGSKAAGESHGGAMAPGAEMPPGHPSAEGMPAHGTMPSGHPPVSSTPDK